MSLKTVAQGSSSFLLLLLLPTRACASSPVPPQADARASRPSPLPLGTAEGGSFDATSFDGRTPPKPSSLPASVVDQLLVKLDLDAFKAKGELDLEGVLAYQRA